VGLSGYIFIYVYIVKADDRRDELKAAIAASVRIFLSLYIYTCIH